MARASEERVQARREEIIKACAGLYERMGFKDVTIKEIGEATSFTRTAIYNYFQTKEEIFLALLQEEYENWVRDLEAAADARERMSADEVARTLAETLEKRGLLLKLMTMNHYDMEENSRMERLAAFKGAYGASLRAVERLAEKCGLDAAARRGFLYAFFPFVYGIYPYAVVSERQRTAMAQAGVEFSYQSIGELVYSCVKRLLEGAGNKKD